MHKTPITFLCPSSRTPVNENRHARNRTPSLYAAEICRPKLPRHHTLYKNAAKITPASPRPTKGWTISAAEAALLVEVEPPELVVDVPEPVLELEVEEEVLVEEVLVDLRLAELTVPLVPEEAVPDEPVGTMTAVPL